MHKRFPLTALAFVLALAARAASAEDEKIDFHPLLGGDTGVAIFQDFERSPGVNADAVDLSWSFFGGVRYEWLGASVGYVDFGELHARGPSFRDRVEYRGATLSGHVFHSFSEQLTISGELGVLFWEQDVDFRDTAGSFNASASDASLLVGFGAGVRFSPTSPLSATIRYNLFLDVGDRRRTGHDHDIDRLGVDVVFSY